MTACGVWAPRLLLGTVLVGLKFDTLAGPGPPYSGSVMMWMYNSDRSDSDNFGDESETSSLLP